MLGDGWPADGKVLGQIADRSGPLRELLQYRAAGRVGEDIPTRSVSLHER